MRQRDVPGIDAAYLAMDTEEGVEVVWNETYFSSLKKLNEQKDKIQKVSGQWQLLSWISQVSWSQLIDLHLSHAVSQVYDHLIALEHANIGRFHDYWIDTNKEKPRVVFITEYMSSGMSRSNPLSYYFLSSSSVS